MRYPREQILRGAALLLIAAVIASYFWTIDTSRSELRPIDGRRDDYFNLLAHGFLKGHLYIDKAVREALLRLPNPYDPALRPPGLALHDASLYNGHYYIYWGAAPVVTLLLPFICLTGHDLPIEYAVAWFVCLNYLILCALILEPVPFS